MQAIGSKGASSSNISRFRRRPGRHLFPCSGQARPEAELDRQPRPVVGVDITEALSEECGRPVTVVNDADAAGLAEQQFGAAKGQEGLVVVTTRSVPASARR